MNNRNDVSRSFDAVAGRYDEQRRKLIPCFDDFYSIAASLASAVPAASPRILDLGAGTGLFSSLLLQRYPEADLTLIDISEKMLDTARERLAAYPNVRYAVGDYTHFKSQQPFDIIISALSIHHLSDEEKRDLYANSYMNLSTGGLFVNADQVIGHSPYIDALYKDDWQAKIEASGLTREELDAAYERTKLDRMAGLEEQLHWLKEAGFAEVDCVYKYFNFVVMFGKKQ